MEVRMSERPALDTMLDLRGCAVWRAPSLGAPARRMAPLVHGSRTSRDLLMRMVLVCQQADFSCDRQSHGTQGTSGSDGTQRSGENGRITEVIPSLLLSRLKFIMWVLRRHFNAPHVASFCTRELSWAGATLTSRRSSSRCVCEVQRRIWQRNLSVTMPHDASGLIVPS